MAGTCRPMFVCLCNGFTERQVRACLDDGTRSVAGVYRCLGKPQCGKCIGHVREMVEAGCPAKTQAKSGKRATPDAVPALA